MAIRTRLTAACCVCMGILLCTGSQAQAELISESTIINNWSKENDFITNTKGLDSQTWVLSGNRILSNGNRTGAIISDFTASGDWSFSTVVQPNSDDDLMGLVFGWQDEDNTYGLTWGGGGVSPYNGIQLIKEVAGVKTVLASNSITWTSLTMYDFSVSRIGDEISASVVQGSTTLFSTTLIDTQFTSGKVGFDVDSQDARFSFGNTDFTEIESVPAPSSLALLTTGLLGLAGYTARRRRQAVDQSSIQVAVVSIRGAVD